MTVNILNSKKKRRTLLNFRQVVVVLSLFFVISCNDKNKDDEHLKCNITNPVNNAQFNIDENIIVTVTAEDVEKTITEVQLYVDNLKHSSKTDFPYDFVINTGELTVGTHTLKAVAINDIGKKGESATVTIEIKQSGTENLNFFSFSDGKIPDAWQVTGWEVDNTLGYNDTYSLKAIANGATITINKTINSTINYVDFYLRGEGTVDFYVDNYKLRVCVMNKYSWEDDYGWHYHGIYLEEGTHTLKWVFNGTFANLDAIRFKNETKLQRGMSYKGGMIAYLDNTAQHGLIAAPEDQSKGIIWGSNKNTGATATAIGTGQSNTTKICQTQSGFFAARLCSELVLNGYSDWFLPSKDELNAMYNGIILTGGFSADAYWSSSEWVTSTPNAWAQSFSSGTLSTTPASNRLCVRAVRAF